MTEQERQIRTAVRTASIVAGAMIGVQVSSKATRDAMFLSNFSIESLPLMLVVAAVISIMVVPATARALSRWGPHRVVPWTFLFSGLLLGGEYGLALIAQEAAAVVVYLHIAVLGAVLISGFWSLISETFDPRTAKREVGRIAGGATLGGLVGGLLTERLGTVVSVEAMLPFLAATHVVCSWRLFALARHARAMVSPAVTSQPEKADEAEAGKPTSGLRLLLGDSYLRNLSLLVMLATMSAGLVDYVFKAEASRMYPEGQDMLRFFAAFYTAISLVTFLTQAFLTQKLLRKGGLANTVSTLPAWVGLVAMAAVAFPGLAVAAVLRGGEAVVRSSFFRSGYELFFTPISVANKRATKTLVDVGADRLGDALAGAVAKLILIAAPAAIVAQRAMLGLSLVLCVFAILAARRLHRGYIEALENRLITRAEELEIDTEDDLRGASAMLMTVGGMELSRSMFAIDRSLLGLSQAAMEGVARTNLRVGALDVGAAPTDKVRALPSPARARDSGTQPRAVKLEPVVQAIVDLRSGKLERVRGALKQVRDHGRSLTPHVIPLLAWDAASGKAVRALQAVVDDVVGQLVDALLDRQEEFAIRRRLPRVLARSKSPIGVAGLFEGLKDRRFEVRFRCGQALGQMQTRDESAAFASEHVYAAVRRECEVDRRVWESQRLLDGLSEDDESFVKVDTVLRKRASRSLEHVFTMLALVLPKQPLRIAYKALHTDDLTLRGTALEYLESVLPDDIRVLLWPLIESDDKAAAKNVPRADVLDALMRSNRSIELNLDALRKRLGAEDDG